MMGHSQNHVGELMDGTTGPNAAKPTCGQEAGKLVFGRPRAQRVLEMQGVRPNLGAKRSKPAVCSHFGEHRAGMRTVQRRRPDGIESGKARLTPRGSPKLKLLPQLPRAQAGGQPIELRPVVLRFASARFRPCRADERLS